MIAGPIDFGYSEYVVYVDESGDHSLTSIDPQFPVFALTFCIFRKVDYIATIIPAIEELKFEFWGHDSVILHETEIRKSSGPFNILLNAEVRERFFTRMNAVIDRSDFDIIASVIHKKRHVAQYSHPMNPYEVALLFCMERLCEFLVARGQSRARTHVVFESRGKNEDRDLEIEFRRICANAVTWGYRSVDFSRIVCEPVFTKKASNSSGLQIADLTARPIALRTARPKQANRAYELIAPKIIERKVFP